MDERGIALLRQLISDVEGSPYPGVVDGELYTIWYEHAQNVAQEALEYINTEHPDGQSKDEPIDLDI